MNKQRKLWGEIPEKENPISYTPDVTPDIAKSMSTFLIDQQVKQEVSEDLMTEHVILDQMNPLIMHTIALHKYLNEITDKKQSKVLTPVIEAPLIPQEPDTDLVKMPRDLTKIPEISNALGKMVLKKCVAVLLAHIGYETTHNSILLFLTDILEDFLIKICGRMKTASEEDLAGFPSYPEKVLTEFGLGGCKGLHEYHENRIVKYSKVMRKRCEALREEYLNLFPDNVIQIREEDVFEVHFPRIDEDVGFSSLETGFQLLHSLETEELMEVEGTAAQGGEGANQGGTDNFQD